MTILALLAFPCQARLIIVDVNAPNDPGTGTYEDPFLRIQDAVDDAQDGENIVIAPGRYTGPGNRDIDFKGKAITVRSIDPNDPNIVAATIIDCNGTEVDPHRAFYFHSGEDANSILNGLTIKNGYASNGAGIYCNSSSPTIINCNFINGSAENWGGGIYCYKSSPLISNCTFTGNSAFEGGAITSYSDWNYLCSPLIQNCHIFGNTASGSGGGINSDCLSTPIISNCLITGNYAGTYGGGGISIFQSNPIITGCTIADNSTDSSGGGILQWYEFENGSTITNCIIANNNAINFGGGIYVSQDCDMTITNCTISGNTARDGGGIYGVYNANTPITNCTIVGNSAVWRGGGLSGFTGPITNCTISGNTAKEGGGISGVYNANTPITNCTIVGNSAFWGGGGLDYCFGPITNCIIWDNVARLGPDPQLHNSTTPTFSCIQNWTGGGLGNIDLNPLFIEPGTGYWDNNSTPQDIRDDFWVWTDGDYHLLEDSPCIDTAKNAPNGFLPETDLDGNPRIFDGDSDGRAIADMGAYEFFAPMVVVTRPQGGEVWTFRSRHEIKWSGYGLTNMDILFSSDGGNNWQIIESSVADTGSYMWQLPDKVDSNQCLVSVVPSIPDANVICTQSGMFTIQRYLSRPSLPPGRRGPHKKSGPELGCIKWQFETDGPVTAGVTIGPGDRVYIACEDGKLYTLKKNNGTVIWSYDANSPLISSPAAGYYGMVYVGSKDGKLHALDWHGRLLWTHTTGGPIYSSAAVSRDGRIYTCSQDGILDALAPNGSELWSFETKGPGTVPSGSIFASPSISRDGTIYICGLHDPNLYALNPEDGSVKWKCNFASGDWPFASPVVAEDGTIYQTLLYDPNLYAIEPNNGTIIWSTDLADPCSGWFDSDYADEYGYADGWSKPALGPDGTIYVSFDDPYLRAVDPNGSIKWVTRLGVVGGFTLTVSNDGLIYTASDDGCLCVLNPAGEEIARFQSDGWLNFPVIPANGRIIVSDGKDNTMLITDVNNTVWAIGSDGCKGAPADLHRPQDLNTDWAVNFKDFALLADDWLGCTDTSYPWYPSPCDYSGDEIYFTGDVNRDLYVDFADLAALVNQWLSEE